LRTKNARPISAFGKSSTDRANPSVMATSLSVQHASCVEDFSGDELETIRTLIVEPEGGIAADLEQRC